MATLIIKTNAGAASTTIDDMGIIIPGAGGSETLIDFDELLQAQKSQDLLALLVDDAFGAGASTLVLNDGVANIAQIDAQDFMSIVGLANCPAEFGVIRNNKDAELDCSLVFDGLATISNIIAGNNVSIGGNLLVSVGPGVAGTDGVNLSQVQTLVAAGVSWKEAVLHANQLDSVNDALSQAVAFYLDGNPSIGDTFIISDGTTTETFTFKAAVGVAFDVAIGATTDDTMDNLVTAINTDSTLWSAVQSAALDSINDGSGTSTSGEVTTIYRTNQSATSFTDRIYGTLTTAAFGQYVNFSAETDYTSVTSTQLPAADPAAKDGFGVGKATVGLTGGDTHRVLEADVAYTWDADALIWNLSFGGFPAAGLGLTNTTGAQYDVGAGAGIIVNANDIEIDFGELVDIAPLGSALSAGVLDEAARADHVHTHGDRGGDGAGSQHDADQIDVEGVYAAIGAPADAETVFGNINALIVGGAKAGKVLQFGSSRKVPASGTRHMESSGGVVGSAAPIRLLRAGILSGASISVNKLDAARAYKLSVQINGTEVESVALLVNTLTAASTAFTTAYLAGDLLRLAVIRTSGAGRSKFDEIACLVEIVDN